MRMKRRGDWAARREEESLQNQNPENQGGVQKKIGYEILSRILVLVN